MTKEAEKALQDDLEESLIAWHIDWKKSNGISDPSCSAPINIVTTEKLDGFVRWAEDRLMQMEHDATVHTSSWQAFVINSGKWWRRACYFSVILINVSLSFIHTARFYFLYFITQDTVNYLFSTRLQQII